MEAIVSFSPDIADAPWRPERELVIANALCEVTGLRAHFVLRRLGASHVLQLALFEDANALEQASRVVVQALGRLPRVHVPGHFREICHVLEWDEATGMEPKYVRVHAFRVSQPGRNQSFPSSAQRETGARFAGTGLLQGPEHRFCVALWASHIAAGRAPVQMVAPRPNGSYEVETYVRPPTVVEV